MVEQYLVFLELEFDISQIAFKDYWEKLLKPQWKRCTFASMTKLEAGRSSLNMTSGAWVVNSGQGQLM